MWVCAQEGVEMREYEQLFFAVANARAAAAQPCQMAMPNACLTAMSNACLTALPRRDARLSSVADTMNRSNLPTHRMKQLNGI
jgi:hypothetical protein